MHLSDHDLRQMDEEWLARLPEERLRPALQRALEDLREARDRLNQTPENSSRPPSSRAPWDRNTTPQDTDKDEADPPVETDDAPAQGEATAPVSSSTPPETSPSHETDNPSPKPKAGKQPGAAGQGRTEIPAHAHPQPHYPACCAACGSDYPETAESRPYSGWYEIDVATLPEGGLRVHAIHHRPHETRCPHCDHWTRYAIYRADADIYWDNTALTAWRLVGANLAAVIAALSQRMRLSRPRIRELLIELFGIHLSIGVIDQTIREAGRACTPLQEQLIEQVRQAPQVGGDETRWWEGPSLLWLWVLVTPWTALYVIGERTLEMLRNVLGADYPGILLSDGYAVYRAWPNRLRCWAHLIRKARGLADSTDARVAQVGKELLDILEQWVKAILTARASPPTGDLTATQADRIARLKALCEQHRDDPHTKLRELAREFLNDWDTILRQLRDPGLPLTNNAAESALRPCVIARKLSHGTRSADGSRAYALLASVIETCRLRQASPWRYLAEVIQAARQGQALPALPPIPS